MTLLARNNCFKGGIIFAALSLGLVAVGGYFALSVFPAASESAAMRPGLIIPALVKDLAVQSSYVPYWTMVAAAVYSLISMTLIYYYFEKTQSPEIPFIGFFFISLAFEIARLAVPLRAAFPFPAMYLTLAARFLLFGRYFGLLSLFVASVYAAGLNPQKQQNILLMLGMAAMLISLNVPVDSLSWDTAYRLYSGYSTMFMMVETGILAITVITFWVTAHVKGSGRYIFIGIGAIMILAGRNIMVFSDTWITPFPGLVLLAAGSWIVCSRLHKEYLWL